MAVGNTRSKLSGAGGRAEVAQNTWWMGEDTSCRLGTQQASLERA
jgi:hypothetical protein